ncbi:uncharacterized protein CELE_F18E9.4 [Caenorhabditis elegans]|uniref:Secreted protein n=1 Tax=Caenorhabditis elegans TaxID=6239 RepID=Q19567_CAEEL|nr:Secreted protein [Caenorhabditis elegans]CCD68432.1 Secreted protein [Caenorhabditis elegans]|eukprot:NP_509454.3 Uncharacterized protein CELE_F18E9.4 [Caenorhabditis elegans]
MKRNMLFILLLMCLFLSHSITAQLTVGGWFFPVSVAPPDPKDNTVYDEDVTFPEAEAVNVTHQEIKDYYEKDKLEKWNNQKIQAVYKKNLDKVHRHHNDKEYTSTTTHDPLEISHSKRFLPQSGIENLVHPPLGGETPSVNEEPIITMSMTPIQSLSQPEEISAEFSKSSDAILEVSATTEKVRTTRVPFIYEIPKKSFDDPLSSVEREKDMMKLKRDVFRLRNEMNLVKALLNKMYKRMYRKQSDFLKKRSMHEKQSTRLSAVQAEGSNSAAFGRVQRRNHVRNV